MAGKFVLTAQLQLQAPTNTAQIRKQIQQQLSNVTISPTINTQSLANANKQLQNTANAAAKANANLRSAGKSAQGLGSALGAAARRFASITIATGFFLGLTRAIGDSVKAALDFEKELIKISQVTGKSTSELSSLTKEVTRLSTTLGVSSQELLTVSRTLLQAGFSADVARKALGVLAKTDLAATFDTLQDTTEGAIALLSQFGREAAKVGGTAQFLQESIDAINAVSKNFAVESKDLIAVIRRTGGVFEAAGGNLNELIALFTSVRATTRETAETIATGFRTIFTRIQRTETVDQLRELGIVLQDSTGKFVGPMEAIKRLSIGLSSLDPRDFRFNQIVEQLGGFRQVGKVIPLIKQYTTSTEALAVANNSAGSTAEDAAKAQQGLGNQIAQLQEKFSALFRELTDSETFRSFAAGAIQLAEAFVKVVDALQPLLPLLASLTAMKLGQIALPALGRFAGVTGKNQGGKIHRFNSGGLVPGSGNRDTVPAMLSPGEFVVRKSSVNSIGAGNLARINGYAGGGKVQEFGAAILDRVGSQDSSSVMLGLNDKFTYQPLVKRLERSDKQAKASPGTTQKQLAQMIMGDYSVKRSGPDQKLKDSFDKHLDAGIIAGMETSSELISSDLGLTYKKLGSSGQQNFLRSINDGAVGNLFEQVLDSLAGEPFDGRASDPRRPFDFIGGLGRLADDFPAVASLQYVDAKASFAKSAPKQMKPKVLNQLGMLSYPEAKDKVKQQAASKPVTKGKFFGGRIGRYSSGGQVDTVPAMLTPGEYVINKSAAQSIGYANLNRMNKGGVAHFSNGGSVGMATPIGFSSSGTAMPTGNARLVDSTGKVVTKMEKLGRAMGKGTQNVNKLGAGVKQGAQNMSLLVAMVGSSVVQMMDLDPVMANTVTQFLTLASVASMVVIPLGEMVIATIGSIAAKGAETVASTSLAGAKLAEFAATMLLLAPLAAVVAAIGFAAFEFLHLQEKAKAAAEEVGNFANDLMDNGGTGNVAQDTANLTRRIDDSVVADFEASTGGFVNAAARFIGAGMDIETMAKASEDASRAGSHFAKTIAVSANSLNSYNSTVADINRRQLEGVDKLNAFSEATSDLTSSTNRVVAEYQAAQEDLRKAKERIGDGEEDEAFKGVAKAAEAAKKALDNQAAGITKAVQDQQASYNEEIKARISAGKQFSEIQNDPAIVNSRNKLKAAIIAEERARAEANGETFNEAKAKGRALRIINDNNRALEAASDAALEKRRADYEAAQATLALEKQAIAAARAMNFLSVIALQAEAGFAAFDAQLAAATGKFQIVDQKLGDFIGSLTKGASSAGVAALRTTAGSVGAGGQAESLIGEIRRNESIRDRLARESGPGGVFSGGIGQTAGRGVAEEFLKQFDLSGLDDKVREEIIKKLSDGIQPGEIEEIFEVLQQGTEEQVAVFKQIADTQKAYVQSYQKAITELLNAKKKERDSVNTLISIQEKGIKRLQQATGEDPGRGLARAGQNARLGNLGVNTRNTTALGKALRGAQQQAQKFGKAAANASDPRVQNRLLTQQQLAADKAERLGEALKLLSDRSAEAAEILSEIDVERGKREAAQKAVKDFTFATNEQRQSMTQNFAALQRVLATGDINSVPDKFRAAVGQLLDQFKDFDFGGGVKGSDISKNLQIRQLETQFRTASGGRQGVPPQLVKAIFSATTKEEKLINELKKLNEEEAAAQKELIAAQQLETQNVMQSIGTLTATMAQLMKQLQVLVNTLGNAEEAGGAAIGGLVPVQGFANGGNVFKPKGTDTVPAMLTPGEFVIRKSAVDKIGVGALSALNNGNASTVYRAFGGPVDGDGLMKSIHAGLRTIGANEGIKKHLPKQVREKFKEMGVLNDLIELSQKDLAGPLQGTIKKLFQHAYIATNNLSDLYRNYSLWRFSEKDKVANRAAEAGGWLGLTKNGSLMLHPAMRNKNWSFASDDIFQASFAGNEIDAVSGTTAAEAEQDFGARRKRAYWALSMTVPKQKNPVGAMFDNARSAWRGEEGLLHAYFNPQFFGDWMALAGAWSSKKKIAPFLATGTEQALQFLARGGSADSVPAMLTPGEFVMSRAAVKKHGTGFMNSLNKGKVPGFARGGSVGGVQYRQNGGAIAGMGQNMMDAIAKSLSIFDNLAGMLNDIAVMFSNLQISHTIQVDGTLNIPGFSQQAINNIVNTIGEQVVSQTENKINLALDEFNRKLDQRAD